MGREAPVATGEFRPGAAIQKCVRLRFDNDFFKITFCTRMPRYSRQYLTQLLAQHDYGALVDLQGVALGWEGFDSKHPSFGLPYPIFVVFELVTWLAQADRSGVWTYYEATPVARLDCVLATLDRLRAVELHQQFAYGKEHWKDEAASEKLDHWIRENEQTIIDWAFAVLKDHPAELALVSD